MPKIQHNITSRYILHFCFLWLRCVTWSLRCLTCLVCNMIMIFISPQVCSAKTSLAACVQNWSLGMTSLQTSHSSKNVKRLRQPYTTVFMHLKKRWTPEERLSLCPNIHKNLGQAKQKLKSNQVQRVVKISNCHLDLSPYSQTIFVSKSFHLHVFNESRTAIPLEVELSSIIRGNKSSQPSWSVLCQ